MSLEERKSLIKVGCEYAAECGATWGLVLPPYYHKTSEEGTCDFFKEVAANSNVGIAIYNYPGATSVTMSPEMIYELSHEGNIVSFKGSADFGHLCQVLTLTKDVQTFTVFTGEEHFILPSWKSKKAVNTTY